MAEFWETNFQDKQMMWGETPALSTIFAKDYFKKHHIKNILIPGIGYGRNAIPFLKESINVTGIEISQTAIELAKTKLSLDIKIHHGSVTEMPFDQEQYDGIFCHAVIHLLDEFERQQLLENCYSQLKKDGIMIFTAISTKSPSFGQGQQIGPNRYEQHGGAKIFFYDQKSVTTEFQNFGLTETQEITESNGMPFFMTICHKK